MIELKYYPIYLDDKGGRMIMQYRAVSLCIFRRDEHYLFVEKYDKTLGITYYRPVGGTIEFGENSIKNDPTKMLVPSGLMDILCGEPYLGINNVIHYSSL